MPLYLARHIPAERRDSTEKRADAGEAGPLLPSGVRARLVVPGRLAEPPWWATRVPAEARRRAHLPAARYGVSRAKQRQTLQIEVRRAPFSFRPAGAAVRLQPSRMVSGVPEGGGQRRVLRETGGAGRGSALGERTLGGE